jgi:transcriptional regulator with XRE-family HTH domain
MYLGKLIRNRRRESNMTQEELGNLIGVKHSYISKIESGLQRGSYESLAKISQALKIPWSEILKIGEMKAPYMYSPDSMFPVLDEVYTEFPPTVKMALIDIGKILKQYME